MDATTYGQFTAVVSQCLLANKQVIALVALGSTADPVRRDQWSDHDFWIITHPGAQEQFLTETLWLPDAHRVKMVFRQGSAYATVLYDDGRLVEYGVFDPEQMQNGKLDRFAVLFDKSGSVAGTCQELVARSMAEVHQESAASTDSELLHYFFLQIATGIHRHARGEKLSGDHLIRCLAVGNLLTLVSRHLDPQGASWRDGFDVRRHFETVYPAIGEDINRALSGSFLEMVVGLLRIVDERLADRIPDFPQDLAKVVHRRVNELNGG